MGVVGQCLGLPGTPPLCPAPCAAPSLHFELWAYFLFIFSVIELRARIWASWFKFKPYETEVIFLDRKNNLGEFIGLTIALYFHGVWTQFVSLLLNLNVLLDLIGLACCSWNFHVLAWAQQAFFHIWLAWRLQSFFDNVKLLVQMIPAHLFLLVVFNTIPCLSIHASVILGPRLT